MKTLIVEDDFTSRLLLQEFLKNLGPVHVGVNGREAMAAVRAAYEAGEPYDLVCLDIVMPDKDGVEVLNEIRAIEEARAAVLPAPGAGEAPRARKVRIVMTTSLGNRHLVSATEGICDAYIVKPVDRAALLERLRGLGLTA